MMQIFADIFQFRVQYRSSSLYATETNYKKVIGRSDRRTLPPEPRHHCKTASPLYSISP